MHVIDARNVGHALIQGMHQISEFGVKRDSRNGPVLVFPYPVTTVYHNPMERVLFFPDRDANPFFHFMEGLWMLSGRNDVEWISWFNSGMANYSDNGVTFHGAYGYRWRNHFPSDHTTDVGQLDQLDCAIRALTLNQDDRRVVIQMWDATTDLGMEGKDFPCNVCILPRINPYGYLDITVINRSNDMIWGAYGANAVHMSMLQEYIAGAIGVQVGRYFQISTNFHAYFNTYDKHSGLLNVPHGEDYADPYSYGDVQPFPMMNIPRYAWESELMMFMEEGAVIGYNDPFFKKVAVPMLVAWNTWKNKDDPHRVHNTLAMVKTIAATDWRMACTDWILRRT